MKARYQGQAELGLASSNPVEYAAKKPFLDGAEKLDKKDIFDSLVIPAAEYGLRDYEIEGETKRIGIK